MREAGFTEIIGKRTDYIEVEYGLTDITPNGGPILHVVLPYNGVDEQVETANAAPDHVEASTSPPALKVPFQRNCTQNKAKESEGRVDWIRDGTRVGRHTSRQCTSGKIAELG